MRDSHSLFDYESSNVKKTETTVIDSRGTLVIDEDLDLHLDSIIKPYNELIHIEKVKSGKLLVFKYKIIALDTFEIKAVAPI